MAKKTPILALFDPFFEENFRQFSVKGVGGYPPFPVRFFWQNDFPLRGVGGWGGGGGTPLTEKIRSVVFDSLNRFGKISKKSVPRNTDMEEPFHEKNMKQNEDMWETKEQNIEETVRILHDVVMRGRKYARSSGAVFGIVGILNSKYILLCCSLI